MCYQSPCKVGDTAWGSKNPPILEHWRTQPRPQSVTDPKDRTLGPMSGDLHSFEQLMKLQWDIYWVIFKVNTIDLLLQNVAPKWQIQKRLRYLVWERGSAEYSDLVSHCKHCGLCCPPRCCLQLDLKTIPMKQGKAWGCPPSIPGDCSDNQPFQLLQGCISLKCRKLIQGTLLRSSNKANMLQENIFLILRSQHFLI